MEAAMTRKYPLHVHIITMFLLLILPLGAVVTATSFKLSRDMLQSVASDMIRRIGAETGADIAALVAPAELAVNMMAHTGLGKASSFAERRHYLPQLREALLGSSALSSIYIGYPDGADFQRYWEVAEHVIAKDILKPHAIYWPTMLRAMGLAPFKRLHVHSYWNVDETKMSKSIGNVVRPGDLVAEYGVDAVRYFVLREMSFGLDASFSGATILERQNSDLANDLGNLFSRALTMLAKYAGGTVPAPDEAAMTDADRELTFAMAEMVILYRREMEQFNFSRALQEVWKVMGQLNRFIVTNAPWELAKDPGQKSRLLTVLYILAEALRLIALVLRPVMPEAAARMAGALGLAELATATLDRAGTWGQLRPGTALGEVVQLFPRLDKKNKQEQQSPGKEKKEKVKPAKAADPPPSEAEGLIGFEQFGAVELRVARVVGAEKVAKSDRLLKLTVQAPEERTIVAGIAKYYQPEEVIGRLVIIVANLKPAKLMGITSQGMVLAAKEKDADGVERLVLATVAAAIAPGSRVA